MPSPQQPAPKVVKVAGVLLALVGVAALVMGVAVTISTVPSHPIVGIGSGLFLAAYGIGLGLVSRGLWRTRRWSRGPAIATQVLHLPVAWSFLGGHTQLIGVAVGAVALIIIGCLVSPPATRALTAVGGNAGAS